MIIEQDMKPEPTEKIQLIKTSSFAITTACKARVKSIDSETGLSTSENTQFFISFWSIVRRDLTANYKTTVKLALF